MQVPSLTPCGTMMSTAVCWSTRHIKEHLFPAPQSLASWLAATQIHALGQLSVVTPGSNPRVGVDHWIFDNEAFSYGDPYREREKNHPLYETLGKRRGCELERLQRSTSLIENRADALLAVIQEAGSWSSLLDSSSAAETDRAAYQRPPPFLRALHGYRSRSRLTTRRTACDLQAGSEAKSWRRFDVFRGPTEVIARRANVIS